MKVRTERHHNLARHIIAIVCVTAFALMITLQPTYAQHWARPNVPVDLEPPAGHDVFLRGHAIGTQNYMCLPSGAGFAWTLVGPQATLFADNGRQSMTHFLSINPIDNLPRATWQHSRDTSSAWAKLSAASSDPAFVAPGAIPWFKLEVVGTQDGPTGGDRLSETTFIQRINTVGGMAPSTGCAVSTDIGKRTFVYYEADYIFYKQQQ